MCVPMAAAAVGLAIATTAASVVSQSQMAKAETRRIKAQLARREAEIDTNTTAEINARLREKRREQGRIEVAAGQAGLNLQSGSVEALLMDSAMQAELANDTSMANRESRKAAARDEAQAAVPFRPTALGAGLQIALAGGNAYMGSRATSMRQQRTNPSGD